jgi:hypothetical protein
VIAPIEMIIVCSKGDWNLHRSDASDLSHAEWLDWTNGVWIFTAERPSRVTVERPAIGVEEEEARPRRS